jgi:hypothetical protein
MNFVGCRKCSSSARSAFGALPGAERSTAKFFVATRLVSVSMGATPAGYFAAIIPSASALRSTISAVPPSALNLLASVFW